MASAAATRTTIGQHLYGVAFLGGAILLVVAAFSLLLIAPVIVGLEGLKLWQRGELPLLLSHRGGIIALSILAWIVAIIISLLLSRADRLNRAFDKSMRLNLKEGGTGFDRETATASDIAGKLLELSAPSTIGFAFSDVIDEDYGAGFWASSGNDTFWVAVNAASDDVEKPRGRFMVSVSFDPGLSLLRRLRHRPDAAFFNQVHRAVADAVRTLRAGK